MNTSSTPLTIPYFSGTYFLAHNYKILITRLKKPYLEIPDHKFFLSKKFGTETTLLILLPRLSKIF